MSIDEEIKAGIRRFLAEKGQKVLFNGQHYDRISPYGWTDYDAWEHIHEGCRWVIPEGTVVEEKSYSMFNGTFADNEDEVGINAADVHCACGKYRDVTIRVTSSLSEAIKTLLGYDPSTTLKL